MRPRERLERYGADHLTNAELLAIIVGSGIQGANAVEVGEQLLKDLHGLVGVDRASLEELAAGVGVGRVTAIKIKAALELGRRFTSLQPGQSVQIRSPRDVYDYFGAEMATLDQEQLRVLLLDTKNVVLPTPPQYQGSLNSTTVRVGELFKEAIRKNAAAVILVHNHPSGDPTPSPEDVRLTRDAVESGRLLDVEVLDHVVVGRGDPGFVSLKERGLGFSPAAR